MIRPTKILSSNTPQFNTKCYNSSNTKLLIDDIKLLEKLSLVNFENQKYVKVVEEAIEFANSINTVNTDEIEPLISLLEDRNLRLRNDVVTDGYCYQDILRNAIVTEENYFVSPPGNIPLDSDTSKNTRF